MDEVDHQHKLHIIIFHYNSSYYNYSDIVCRNIRVVLVLVFNSELC